LNVWLCIFFADSRIPARLETGCSAEHPDIRLPVTAPAPAKVAVFKKLRRLVVIAGKFSGLLISIPKITKKSRH
jgi:hypothetical protein